MTVQTNTSVANFEGNGVTQIFPIAFKFNSATDLVALLIDKSTSATTLLTLNSDYTVSGEGDEEGGLINVTIPPAVGKRLRVTRLVEILQLTDLRNQGKFFAETHEDALDLLTMIAQQLESGIKSALRVAESDPEPERIPSVSQRAGKILSFDSNGSPQVVAPVTDSSTVLRIDLAAPGGADLVGFQSGNIGDALRALSGVSAHILVMDAPAGGTDSTLQVTEFFEKVDQTGAFWIVPAGTYSINPPSSIKIKKSGICLGVFEVPKSNQAFRFEVVRDAAGTVVDTAGWSQIVRGVSDVNAQSAAGKNLLLASTEVQIERIGSGGAAYRKEEFIRCMPTGSFSTPAVNTYNSFENLTVTAHEPSKPIRISGLSVLLTGEAGGTEANRGYIVVTRDNVTMDDPQVINSNPTQPKPVAIEVSYCADVILNRPVVKGFNYSGLGYGILNGSTIGLTVNDPNLQDCRHAYTGAYTVDVTLNRGTYGRIIDDHWTDRFTANNPKVYALPGMSAFAFAGSDVTINDPVVSGGRNLFAIRNDTPSMGGRVIIRNPIIKTRGESGYYYLFGFSSPNGQGDPGFSFTNTPKLPDYVEISSPTIDSDTVHVYGAYLGMLYFPHTTWGEIALKGNWKITGSTLNGVFSYKNSTYQLNRVPLLSFSGIECGAGMLLNINSLDSVTSGAYSARLDEGASGNLRYSGGSVGTINAVGARIGSITNDNAAIEPTGTYRYVGCTFSGGSVSATLRNHLISSSIFAAAYGTFPTAANISMDGNVRLGAGVTGLPADIRNNIVAPFAS